MLPIFLLPVFVQLASMVPPSRTTAELDAELDRRISARSHSRDEPLDAASIPPPNWTEPRLIPPSGTQSSVSTVLAGGTFSGTQGCLLYDLGPDECGWDLHLIAYGPHHH